MKTILVETYKIKSKDLVPKHDELWNEWIKDVIDNANRNGWKIPPHEHYTNQGDELGRLFMVVFDNLDHQKMWMSNVKDDKFHEYEDEFKAMVDDWRPLMVSQYKTY